MSQKTKDGNIDCKRQYSYQEEPINKNNKMKPKMKREEDAQWCDAGMYSGMTITMCINYAHVAQQYFLLRFTRYVVN